MYITDQLLLTKDPYDYKSISQGVVTVDGLDDGAELLLTDVCILITLLISLQFQSNNRVFVLGCFQSFGIYS